jgi:hypothetical protein
VYPGFHPGLFSAIFSRPFGTGLALVFVKFDKIRSFLVVLERWQSCSLRRNVQVRREAQWEPQKKSRRGGMIEFA